MRVLLRVAAGPAADRIASRALALLGAVLLLAGCASLGPQLPMSVADETASEEISFGVRTLDANGQFEVLSSREVARRIESRLGDRPLTILAFSSGGANGAFGAGALIGATHGGTRPEFTVVTGVSTGALVAPFAFLGSAWDAKMTEIFTTGATGGLFRRRGLGALFGSSVYSGVPLRRLIDRYADDTMIAAIAAQAAKGRLLLVATTDLATGEPVIWDLGSIALHGGKYARPLIRRVLLASASVPGMLPPVVVRVRIRGRMRSETHVDGGVTLPFFIAPEPQDLPHSTVVVRVIIDGSLRNLPRPTRASALSVFRRSLAAGLSQMTRTRLEATVEALRQRGIALGYAAIPDSYPLDGSFDFSRQAQRSLFEYAENCAAAGRLWIDVRAGSGAGLSALAPATTSPMCPADDAFFERLAALRD
jgi:predicted acylesterase/phospholipase RssA